ncbi:TPA: hypothetical protein DEW47_01690 [Patescibacteria group bacterium]|nr:MAG: hypothetical protein UT71_C0009G0013 [Parcubacteria group bacterium GW2011_GWF2_40_10]KKR47444.1 MAG: hypothetical protein UT83_C0009G0010 [Parcubacteria group bacterium GW2011_GWA2_40_143]KKR59865.1 MAG: hypothetical protein UT97_C0009G0010 [Parcubacteria group bacterium GW2011_GWC2_40_31]KKR74936.1 MAG: hypothetical protein UU18_C0016G0012 [Parcubacteria group bacterium GW2011_GWB2_40_8]KKR76342.1 MAG: hypothetical protein UU20_C0027G0014 [Parcubacteria group bacterium GW2011_GWE2_40_
MKSKKFVIPIIFLVAIDAVALIFLFFAVSAINEEKKDILAARELIAKNEKNIDSNSSLKKLASDIEDDKLKVFSMFLSRDELIRIIKSLESIESDSGVSLKISSIDMDEKQSVVAPTLNFTVKGSFHQLFRYLYFLENLPYLIIIDKATFYKIETDEDGGDQWQANFNIKLEGYEK